MTDLSWISTKLAMLIPRLATNHDGEVVATVRAIQRTLAGEGMDLHDPAAALEPRSERVDSVECEPEQVRPRTWPGIARWLFEKDRGRLSQREADFVRSMVRHLVLANDVPFEKQGAWLCALYARIGGGE